MKASRLLSALLLLQGHGRLSTRDIAERLQVSQRTAHRDMESLCQAGVPLVALRGAQGGWELSREWRTKVPGFDETELRALLMAQPSALGAPDLVAAAEGALRKLLAAMPAAMQSEAASMLARLHVDPTGWWPSPGGEAQNLPAVQEAIARDRQLRFRYEAPKANPVERTVDPLGLVCKQSIWYLVARTAKGMRTYRVSRMSEAAVLASTFTRPPFDLASYWESAKAEVMGQRHGWIAKIALSPEAAATLSHWLPIAPAVLDDAPAIPDGWTAYTVPFESFPHAKFITLGMGSGAMVISPSDLRDAIRTEVHQMAAIPQ